MHKSVLSKLKQNVNAVLSLVNYTVDKDYSNKIIKKILSQTDLILDVGANTGQYGKKIRKHKYKGEIISFEPLEDAHSKLLEITSDDKKWLVYDRIALGDKKGEATLNIAKNSVSSSLLNILKSHIEAAPDSKYIGREKVQMSTITDILNQVRNKSENVLLKIDTQGYEYQIIQGAIGSLNKISFIELELSVQELYQGQKQYLFVLNYLEKLNFQLINLRKSFESPINGTLLQFDAIFCRKDKLNLLKNQKDGRT